ncbi:MAG: GNAT family N-acetyltransferase [Myxococcales bacterium]
MHSEPLVAPKGESAALTGGVVFAQHHPVFGPVQIRRMRNPEDIPTVHAWVGREYARFWGMVGYSSEQVAAGYREIARNADVFLGFQGDTPIFLIESYDPRRDPVGGHYEVLPGDRGMHVLMAPPDRRVKGFSWAVFSLVMDFLFADPGTKRIVVEPDIRNRRIHALNRRAGFRYQKMIELGSKTAHLAFCTRAHYLEALATREDTRLAYPRAPTAPHGHVQPEAWQAANRALICKAISEFAHEALLEPVRVAEDGPWGVYVLEDSEHTVSYRFRARMLALDHWWIRA